MICDKEIGVCIGGCLEGWKFFMCNECMCILFKIFIICYFDF